LATSAWQNNNKALLNGKGSIHATVVAKESYRHAQASLADPPLAHSFPLAPSPAN
jgi:hypothetical protein